MVDHAQRDASASIPPTGRIPLAKRGAGVWPGVTSTRGIVSATMLALAMIVLAQLGERLDTLMTGGLFPVAGRIVTFTIIAVGTLLFGGVPGLIVAEINPLVATATGSNPIAPFFFITNALQVLAAIVATRLVKDIISLKYCFVYAFLGSVLLTVAYIPLHMFYFKLPALDMLQLYAVQIVVVSVVVPFFLFPILKLVNNAGFIDS